MAFEEVLAKGLLELSVHVNTRDIQASAQQAADQAGRIIERQLTARLSRQIGQVFTRTEAVQALSKAFGGIAEGLTLKPISDFERGALRMTRTLQGGVGRLTETFRRMGDSARFSLNTIVSRMPRAAAALGGLSAVSAQVNAALARIGPIAIAAAVALAVVGGVAVKIGRDFAKAASEFQVLQVQLNAIISNSDTANISVERLTDRISKLAIETGFSRTNLLAASQALLGVGVSGTQTLKIIEALARASALYGKTNEQVTLALDGLGRMAARGTLSMQVLQRQISENLRGVIDFNEFMRRLSIETGRSVEDLRRNITDVPVDVGLRVLVETLEATRDLAGAGAVQLQSLTGILGILRARFNQLKQDAFQPFVEALGDMLRKFAKSGAGFDRLQKIFTEFGETFADTVIGVFEELVPLIPQLLELFKNLFRVVGPIIVEFARFAGTLGRVLIPILNFVTQVVDVLLNKLGPVSFVLRTIVTALIGGGVIRALGLFGRAVGSVGGLLGRIATPIAKFVQVLGRFGPIVSGIIIVVLLLRQAFDRLWFVFEPIIRGFKIFGEVLVNIVKGALNLFKRAVEITIQDFARILWHFERLPFGVGKAVRDVREAIEGIVDSVRSTTEEVGRGAGLLGKAFTDRLKHFRREVEVLIFPIIEALEELEEKFSELVSATKALETAQSGLITAQRRLRDATRQVAALQSEYASILADTASEIRELQEAEEDLLRIRWQIRDLNREEIDLLERIAELRSPATAEELAAADRLIQRAKIALNRAIRTELALLNELNQEQRESIDLTGLSLDQLRTRLSDVRASLAVQRQSNRVQKTAEEIEEDQLEARLNVEDAQISLNEALREREDLDNKILLNAEKIRDVEEQLVRLAFDRTVALRREGDAQQRLNRLREGDTTRARTLRDLQEQITNAVEAQKEAANKVAEAERAITEATLERQLALAKVLEDEEGILRIKLQQLAVNQDLLRQVPNLADELARAIAGVTVPATAGLPEGLGGLGVGLDISTNVARDIITQQLARLLINDPNAFRDALRRLGINLAQGAVVTSPTLANIGERFRPEVVLPLSRPDRAWQLLAQSIPHMALPLKQRLAPVLGPQRGGAVSGLRLGSGGAQTSAQAPLTRAQGDRLIALLEKLAETDPHADINLEVHASPGMNEQQLIRKAMRELKWASESKRIKGVN